MNRVISNSVNPLAQSRHQFSSAVKTAREGSAPFRYEYGTPTFDDQGESFEENARTGNAYSDRVNGAVQIEEERRAMLRQGDEPWPPSIVRPVSLLPDRDRGIQQEASQSVRIGKAPQGGQVLKDPV